MNKGEVGSNSVNIKKGRRKFNETNCVRENSRALTYGKSQTLARSSRQRKSPMNWLIYNLAKNIWGRPTRDTNKLLAHSTVMRYIRNNHKDRD